MNSLVGYGVSSDSESDGDGDDVNNSTSTDGVVRDGQKSRNFLLETGSASSESDPEEEPRLPLAPAAPPTAARTPSLPPPLMSPKLPPPPLGATSRSSVFANPFKAQADEKLNALQKHVPLTLQARPSQIGGKRMCVAYRKDGRCRFGIKCKFGHDSDLQSSIIPNEYDPPSADDVSGRDADRGVHHRFPHHHGEDQGETEGQQGRRKRVGLSNNLVPPKRAMKQYAMQKERERVNLS